MTLFLKKINFPMFLLADILISEHRPSLAGKSGVRSKSLVYNAVRLVDSRSYTYPYRALHLFQSLRAMVTDN